MSAGGSDVRLRLSDYLGWMDGDSDGYLKIGHVTVAGAGSGAAADGAPVTATFGNAEDESVDIAQGADVYSNPVDLTATAGQELDVSIWLENDPGDTPENTMCSACTEYVSAGSGDDTAAVAGTDFTASGSVSGNFSDILTGIDTLTSGTPDVSVLGDNLIDAYYGSVPDGAARRRSGVKNGGGTARDVVSPVAGRGRGSV